MEKKTVYREQVNFSLDTTKPIDKMLIIIPKQHITNGEGFF